MKCRIEELGLPESSGARYFLLYLDRIGKNEVEKSEEYLNKDDLQKAQKFLSQQHSHRCMLIYALIKKILGALLGISPVLIAFSRNQFGKPYLNKNPLHFNLSHSESYALLGVHSSFPIGVDIEKRKRRIPLDSFLYPSEKQDLETVLDPTLLWSIKEAYVKALGIGFTQTLPFLKHLYSDRFIDISLFISRITGSFPPLLVHGYSKIAKNYNLATCIYKQ